MSQADGTDGRATVRAVVTTVRAAGNHDAVSLVVPDDERWGRARPGQFVVVPTDPAAGGLRPEVHWLAGASADAIHGTSIELLLPLHRATVVGEELDLLGPLGRGFAPPAQPVPVLLVGHESGAVPLRWLLELLRSRGCEVHVLLGAGDPENLVDLVHLRRHARTVLIAPPEDLTSTVDRVLDDPAVDPAVVYAAAPVPALRQISSSALARGRAVRVCALDLQAEGPVCGTGLCGACDVDVHDGRAGAVLRPCLEGPVVPGEWLVRGESG